MIEFDSHNEIQDWVRRNTTYQNGKLTLGDVNRRIEQARKDGATIFNQLRREAKSLGIPESVIEHDLPAFVGDFHVVGGTVRSVDGLHTPRTFLSQEQVGRSHWQENSQNTVATSTATSDAMRMGKPTQADLPNKNVGLADMFEVS